jgi:hypothetical protein
VFSRQNPTLVLPPEPADPKDEPPSSTEPDLVIDGVGINLLGCGPPRTLAQPECQVSPYVSLLAGVQLDSDGLDQVKRELGARVFWSRVFPSTKPLLLLDVIGQPAVRVPPRNFRPPPSDVTHMPDTVVSEERRRENLEIGVGAIKFIRSISKDVMVAHNRTYWYLTGDKREPGADDLAAALKPEGIEITRMVKYLPARKNREDSFKWYNLPHDGHWSDAGAEVYGEAMAKAVRERLFLTRRKPEGTALGNDMPAGSAN